MVSYPKITIVTPNFNGAHFLEKTIQSVLNQNYPNLEYIIIDGGSTDGSIEIIKKYESELAWWISEPDKGMYHAIQKGFERSTGEIMAWINSDDMYHRNAFLTIAEIFSSFPSINWIVGASTVYDELGRTVSCYQSRFFSKYDFYNNDFKWIQQESVFWRRTLWVSSGSGLDTNLIYAGDFELWLRFFHYDRLFVTHALVGGFRFRTSNQITLDHMDDYLMEVECALKKVNLSDIENKILQNYRRLIKIVNLLKIFKIFHTDLIINLYRSKYFPNPPTINFDRTAMKFILND